MSLTGTESNGSENKKRLRIVALLTGTYLIAEVVGGLWTGSLALLADAGHMLTDVGGLLLALFAIHIGQRPATPERTYGFYRAEILAALANAVVLIGISLYILYEAYQRFQNPPQIEGPGMLLVAAVGLVVNLIGVYILRKNSKDNLNMKGAYFEVMSDLLTSIAVIIAGVVIWFTGWTYVDPLFSAGIGLFILPRTWNLMKDAVGVLLEGTPSDINPAELRLSLTSLPGILYVHDLHVWSLTSGNNSLTAHIGIASDQNESTLLRAIQNLLKENFKILHSTIQFEREKSEGEPAHN